jgi:hypothetical protein
MGSQASVYTEEAVSVPLFRTGGHMAGKRIFAFAAFVLVALAFALSARGGAENIRPAMAIP